MESISDFPDTTYGFVYMITHMPTGKSYIGKKILQNMWNKIHKITANRDE